MSATMTADAAIVAVVNAFLPQNRGVKPENGWEGLFFRVQVRGDYYDSKTGREFAARREVYMIIHNRGGSYKQVWATAPAERLPGQRPEDFQPKSYHDSCWRDDGVRRVMEDAYMEVANAIMAAMDNAGLVGVAPNKMRIEADMGVMGRIQYVRVWDDLHARGFGETTMAKLELLA